MSGVTAGRMAVIAALRRELAGIRRWLPGDGRFGPWQITLSCSGMGVANAAANTRELLVSGPGFDLLLSIGFAGSLSRELESGDLLVAEEVFTPSSPWGSGPEALPADGALLARSRQLAAADFRLHFGRLLTVSSVVQSPADKKQLGSDHEALAVDMESIAVLSQARAAAVPALCVRAIVDEVDFELPSDLSRLTDEFGAPRLLRTAARVLRRPRTLTALLGLQRRSAVAADHLARWVRRFVSEPWSEPPAET